MGRLKIHASVFALAVLAIAIGKGLLLATYLISVLLHEAAHCFALLRRHYVVESIELSAFGAVLYGQYEEGGKEQLAIALAGPVANGLICLICVALWYIVPDSYHFTYEFCMANAVIAATNLLPCYPLDGGKALCALFVGKYPYHKVLIFAKTLTVIVASLLFLLFLVAFIVDKNLFSLGLFSIFLLSSSLGVRGSSFRYKPPVKNITMLIGRGAELKTLVIDGNATLAQAAEKTAGNALYEIEVKDDSGKSTAYYDVFDWNRLLRTVNPDTKLKEIKREK